jgi:antitoxin component YwqK of YwqJK toxin-antitoxin module
MKSNLHFILLLLIPILSFSQTPISKKIYLDSLWNETTEINHKYYRIIKSYNLDQDIYNVSDYYKSGILQMKGTSKSKDYLQKEGQFIFYYENGNKKSIANYVNSIPKGKQFDWYENGKIKSEIEYLENQNGPTSEISVNQFWNTENIQKVIDGNGDYEYSDDRQSESGKIKNGFHDGIWKGYNKNLNSSYTENYENGKFISGLSIDSSNIKHEYKEMFSKPKPKKGMDDFYGYIGKTFNTPKVEGLKGKIYITFVVDRNGKIIEPKIHKDLGYGTGEEAIRVLTSYGNWIPGQQRGINVRVLYSIPITIESRY